MPLLGYDIFFILLALKDIKKAIKLKKTNKGLKSHLKARKPKFKNLIILGEESKNEEPKERKILLRCADLD